MCLLLAVASARAAPTFESTVLPIFSANCLPCHSKGARTSGFSIEATEDVIAGGARNGPAVQPGNAAGSLLVKVLRGSVQPQMPPGKTLPAQDIAAIEAWIQALPPTAAKAAPSRYWAFVKSARHPVPEVREGSVVGNAIDAFILSKLAEKSLTLAPEADRRTLMRRLYFDLVGVPPRPEEVKAFVEDRSPKAYENLVDSLLADVRYGERWGRHWLDLARYADTNGYEGDPEWPHAWRYRDYVIDSFNQDKPYDQFVKEQIAGDEFFQIVSAVPAPLPEPEKQVALSFLRMAPFNRTPVSDENRDSLLSEMTSTVSSVFLGLTVGCAKCHNHKYDMVPTRDFYRMKAFFASVQITNTGRAGGYEPADFYKPGQKAWADETRAQYKKDVEQAETEFKEFQKPLLVKLTAAKKLEKPVETKPEDTKPGDAKPGDTKELTAKDLEREINSENNNASGFDKKPEIFARDEKDRYFQFTERIGRLKKATERLEPLAMGLRNADGPPMGPNVPTTYVLNRGEYDSPGEPVEPGFLSAIEGHTKPAVLELDRYKMFPTRGRRMTLGNWIASPNNPLTSRVMVNRIWQHHFGRGIVETSSDFGKNGTAPSHPELLDWLANRFVEEKWSIKAMHRLILTSSVYRQTSSKSDKRAEQDDPDNRLLWRFPRHRLEGEAIRDSVLAVSGRLNLKPGGPPVYPPLPEGLDEAQKVQGVNTWETSAGEDARRRSIYIFQRRALNMPFLETFDAPVFNAPCDRRRHSITALQALSMYDSDFVNEEARHFAGRVRSETGPDSAEQIRSAFQIAFGRAPKPSEAERAQSLMAAVTPSANALTALCRALLNSSEFIYID